MGPEDKRRLADAEPWLDIPDPLVGSAMPSSPSPSAPSAPSLTRAEVRVRRLGALFFSVAWGAAALLFCGVREGIAESSSFVAGQTFVFALLLLSALALAVTKGARGLGAPAAWARSLAIAAPFVFMIVGLVWLPAGAPGGFGAVGPVSQVMGCLFIGTLTFAPMVALALWSVRRSFPSAATWRGALLGAASGLATSIVLTLHCNSPFGGHIALAHGLPIALATLAGGLLGRKLARA